MEIGREGRFRPRFQSGGFAWLATNDGGSEFFAGLASKYWCSQEGRGRRDVGDEGIMLGNEHGSDKGATVRELCPEGSFLQSINLP